MNRCIFVLLGLLAAAGLGAQTLSVAAAANLAPLEGPLKTAWAAAHPEAPPLQFTFASSGTLVTQITTGAPYEVFLSADLDFAAQLVKAGKAPGPVVTYARGHLIFLTTGSLDLSQGLAVVATDAVTQFALANPETAPYGRAAVEALTKAGLWDRVKAKAVVGQNITQALQFTLTAAGQGFVHRSALTAPALAPYRTEGKFWFAVDPGLYTPLDQGLVVLPGAGSAAANFVKFLTSAPGRQVLASAGYGLP